ncbi:MULTISPECIES: hypothetical protein [unclassified Mesorhizobium]|uniref:hypothetical protein n=1 Tax=unclassified Mesorhizobium TaxID=325217 RepID=UPI00112E5570|nr:MULTISPECIES: hypothetical protein [unclassified Mesorhizobium]TPL42627.1 hypothetical protein FJ961_08025 [Mesorhizobium sp. B2-4-5]TPL66630.1 hypothetical protein FJ949_09705 [Mesorhizobium sp. B2-4-1]
MTAINVLVGYSETHLFADTGHYNQATKKLDHLAPKVFPLPNHQALLAWSGPSAFGPVLAELCRGSPEPLMIALPRMIAGLGILAKFSAIVVGAGWGIAVEEGGKVHHLAPGSVVRSITAENQLDPSDLRGSGVRLMEEQRQSSGVVFGECQYWHLTSQQCTMQVLHDWRDRPSLIRGALSTAAKIANLTVDKLNVAPNAVTKIATGTTTITSGGDGSYPNIIWIIINCVYHGTRVDSSGVLNVFTKRSPSNEVVGGSSKGFSGNGDQPAIVKVNAVDVGMAANQQYSISTNFNFSGSNATCTINSITTELFYTVK